MNRVDNSLNAVFVNDTQIVLELVVADPAALQSRLVFLTDANTDRHIRSTSELKQLRQQAATVSAAVVWMNFRRDHIVLCLS